MAKKKPDLNILLRQNVRRLLDERNWSQVELARRMNATPNMLSQLLIGYRNAGFTTTQKLAEAFEVEPHELLREPTSAAFDKVEAWMRDDLAGDDATDEHFSAAITELAGRWLANRRNGFDALASQNLDELKRIVGAMEAVLS